MILFACGIKMQNKLAKGKKRMREANQDTDS